MLEVKVGQWNYVEEELDNRADNKVIEADTGGLPGAVKVSEHLAYVIGGGAHVGDREDYHESAETGLLTRHSSPHDFDYADEGECLNDDKQGKGEELHANEEVGNLHEERRITLVFSVIFREPVKEVEVVVVKEDICEVVDENSDEPEAHQHFSPLSPAIEHLFYNFLVS